MERIHRGLKLCSTGLSLWLVAIGVGLLLLVPLALVTTYLQAASGSEAPVYVVLALIGILPIVSYAYGLVGRVRCLGVPPEASAAFSRIRIALLFEAAGLVSLVALIAVCLTGLTMEWYIIPTWIGFALLLFYLARVYFVLFLTALARFIGDTESTNKGRLLSCVVIYTPLAPMIGVLCALAVALGLGDEAGSGSIGMVVVGVVVVLVPILALAACFMYFGLVYDLRDNVRGSVVTEFTRASETDPDHAYRERHRLEATPPP